MLLCTGTPGTDAPGTVAAAGVGSQFRRGINMKAVVPTAIVPITSSATWPERFTGSRGGSGRSAGRRGRRLPKSLVGGLAGISINHASGVEQARGK